MKRLFASLLLVAAIPLAALSIAGPASSAPSQGTSIVRNGSFEKPKEGATYFQGQKFGHWLVTRRSIDVVRKVWQTADGVQCVDLSGYNAGVIKQVLDAEVGQVYTLSFALAGNTEGGPAIMKMLVWWEDIRVAHLTFDTTGHSSQDMGWIYYSFQVTATSPHPVLKFMSRTFSVHGPVLDDVSVVPTEG